MARSLLIPDPENATIEELKQVSRVGSKWHKRKTTNWHNWQPIYLPPYSPSLNPIERIWLTMKARWFNNHVCKNEEKLLERLDQAILHVIYNPEKTQQTTAIGTLF